MTLLELLKEHLKEWPQDVVAMAQDSDGEISVTHIAKHCKSPKLFGLSFFVWPYSEGWLCMTSPDGCDSFWYLPTADDARTAIVTREMWEAA